MTPATITIDGVELCVPMDSPYFRWLEFDKCWAFKIPHIDVDVLIHIGDETQCLSIIAAVARCYWLDKATAIEDAPIKTVQDGNSVRLAEPRQLDVDWKNVQDFKSYANAWARVGKK